MSNCIVCGAPLFEKPLLICENMPSSAQDIPTGDEVAADAGLELRLCQCSGCGLIQFDCEPVSYYRDVIRAGGYSTTMRDLRREQYGRFIERCGLAGKKIIEVGCGQGEFLQELRNFPVEGYGIEHKKELVGMAREKGLLVTEGFTETPAQRLEGAPFDGFLSFNFLEHQPDPNTMLRCIYNNLAPEGYGLITVPSFEYIMENGSYYELLRDHIANYTEDTLAFLVRKNGFTVLDTRRVNRDTIEMTVKKCAPADVSRLDNDRAGMSERMQRYVGDCMAQGKKVAIWGASHQGFTVASTTGVQEHIRYIIDSAPFKQGKFAPASHLPIVSPKHFFGDPVDVIIIVAPGYTDEIAGVIRSEYGPAVEICDIRTMAGGVLHLSVGHKGGRCRPFFSGRALGRCA